MSAFDLKTIPSATELRKEIMQLKQKKIEEEAEKQREKEEAFKKMAGAYKKSMNDGILKALKKMRENLSTQEAVNLKDLKHCEYTLMEVHNNKWVNYDVHGVLYENDIPCIEYLSPIFENLFKDIQNELFQKGYYLLQKGEGRRDFILSIGKPDGYDQEQVLYNGFNKIPCDL